jgi:CheY-like chemotaxis protein
MCSKKIKYILVVDDIIDWRITVVGMFEDEGHRCDRADSSANAIQLLEKNYYDLVWLDLRMDAMQEDNIDGLQLAKMVKNRWSSTKIVLSTGYETPEIFTEALKPNPGGKQLVDMYLAKKDAFWMFTKVLSILEGE